jgi:hypothetical protein
MSHPQQRAFVRSIRGRFPTFFVGQRVLEVGSLEMKGKNNGCVRGFFSGCDYTGLDLREGPGVDVVCPGQDYGAPITRLMWSFHAKSWSIIRIGERLSRT